MSRRPGRTLGRQNVLELVGVAVNWAQSCMTASMVSTMRGKLNAPLRNSTAASSFAALYTAGMQPPAVTASRARRTAGKTDSSRGSKSQVWDCRKSTG